jgi:hypothetical protein
MLLTQTALEMYPQLKLIFLPLTLIGMSYERKKNAHLQGHLKTFFYKTQ